MRHPVVVRHEDERTLGERAADRLASTVGSWRFLCVQTALIVAWMAVNGYVAAHEFHFNAWDPYPFILLNLCLSLQAAYTGPVLQLSGNRQAQKDRDLANHDYRQNAEALDLLKEIHRHLEEDA